MVVCGWSVFFVFHWLYKDFHHKAQIHLNAQGGRARGKSCHSQPDLVHAACTPPIHLSVIMKVYRYGENDKREQQHNETTTNLEFAKLFIVCFFFIWCNAGR